ncbi:MAG: hypothetical protein P1U40_03495 [Coxiellaceae bacterium]|nr:hypothetical protein [Coxiellaceae bacterium]
MKLTIKINIIGVVFSMLMVLCVVPIHAASHLSMLNTEAPGGPLLAMVEDKHNNALYIAGHFQAVGTVTGGGAMFKSNGHLAAVTPRYNGKVWASVEDGDGGFYVAGDFTDVDHTGIAYLAHIESDGSVDHAFKPALSSPIRHLAFDCGMLYAADRLNVYEINTDNAAVEPAFATHVNKTINSLAATDNAVYIGGIFSQVNGVNIRGLAKLDYDTGAPDVRFFKPNRNVKAITADYRGNLYVIVYHLPSPVIKINETTGNVDGKFTFADNRLPYNVAYDRNYIYVLRGKAPFLRRYDAVTGQQDTGFPDIKFDIHPDTLNFDDYYLYVTGGFYAVNNDRDYQRIVRFDRQTFALDRSYHPIITNRTLTASLSKGDLFVGGYFQVASGKNQSFLAKLNLLNNKLDPTFHPVLNNSVNTLVLNGDTLYVGGRFTKVNGHKANYVVALSKTTGETVPTGLALSPNRSVNTLRIHDGYLYVGGAFTNIARSNNTKYMARFNLHTQQYDRDFALGLDQQVWDVVFAGDAVYVGGDFTDKLRKYKVADGSRVLDFQPNLNRTVKNILVDGEDVYAAGYFSGAMARLNSKSGETLQNFALSRGFSLAKDGKYIYMGGQDYLQRLDTETKQIDSNFSLASNGIVYTLLPSADVLYAGGYYTKLQGELSPYFAMIDLR